MLKNITIEGLEQEVRLLRKRLGIEFQTLVDPATLIFKLKKYFDNFDYLRVSDGKISNAEAQWDSYRELMIIPEAIFSAMQSYNVRARFTIAHEVGHFYLGHTGIRNRSHQKTIAEEVHKAVIKEERDASRFAAVFLAPSYLVSDSDNVADLIKRFCISEKTANIRREEVNALNRRASNKLRPLPEAALEYLKEAKRLGHSIKTDLGE